MKNIYIWIYLKLDVLCKVIYDPDGKESWSFVTLVRGQNFVAIFTLTKHFKKAITQIEICDATNFYKIPILV